MSAHYWERLVKALENTPDDTVAAYRSGLQSRDATDSGSLSSVPMFHCYEKRSIALSVRFSDPSAVVSLVVWRGYTPVTNGSSTGTFIVQDKESYSFTAPPSGGETALGKFVTDAILFGNISSRAIKITMPHTPSAGTVDLWVRRIP